MVAKQPSRSILLRRGTALVLQVAAAADAAGHVRWLAPPLTCVAAGGGRRRAAGAGVIVAQVAGNGGDDVAAAADGQVLIHDSVVADEIDDVDARHVGHVVALLVDDRGVDVNGESLNRATDPVDVADHLVGLAFDFADQARDICGRVAVLWHPIVGSQRDRAVIEPDTMLLLAPTPGCDLSQPAPLTE